MSQQDPSPSSYHFFPVTGEVTFKPMTGVPQPGVGYLPPGVVRLVSLVSLGIELLGPLSGCDGLGESTVPCPTPTPNATGTLAPDGTPTATCTTRSGTHSLWIPDRGGWVQSDDGVHPNQDAHGVGGDDAHGGVGDGHAGAGHGGGGGG